jgi:PHS family inorganic phosphate transporter-like MFS transporter
VLGDLLHLAWRIILGVGCLPGAVLTLARLRVSQALQQRHTSFEDDEGEKSEEFVTIILDVEEQEPTARALPVSVIKAIFLERDLVTKLMGTAGTWLLFDILFYGNTLF